MINPVFSLFPSYLLVPSWADVMLQSICRAVL